MHADELKDVYVTDHTPRVKKFNTNSESEDVQYYNYMKSLEDYKRKFQSVDKKTNPMESGKYARGSLLQRMLEPLAGSVKLDNGSVYLEVLDKDLKVELDEDRAKKLYDLYKQDQVSEDDDASDEIRISMARDRQAESNFEKDVLREKMDAEFELFLKGEKYDFVTDLVKSNEAELSTPLESKIFDTIPSFVFYDIKKPRIEATVYPDNPTNPSRKNPNVDFFEMRKYEQWVQNRKEQKNLVNGISDYRNY